MVRERLSSACPEAPTPQAPVRTCIGCRKRATKSELLRVVVGSEQDGGAVLPDLRGTASGRGAYLHRTVACYELAHRRRAFGRALRFDGGLATDAVRAALESPET